MKVKFQFTLCLVKIDIGSFCAFVPNASGRNLHNSIGKPSQGSEQNRVERGGEPFESPVSHAKEATLTARCTV